jgi:hypothetical protein
MNSLEKKISAFQIPQKALRRLAFQYRNATKTKKAAHFFLRFCETRLMILIKPFILNFIQ